MPPPTACTRRYMWLAALCRRAVKKTGDIFFSRTIYSAFARTGLYGLTSRISRTWRLSPAGNEQHIAWARDFYSALQPYFTGGSYINFMGDESQERVKAAYGVNYDRLLALKNKYDPTNFFRLNQNIRPTV